MRNYSHPFNYAPTLRLAYKDGEPRTVVQALQHMSIPTDARTLGSFRKAVQGMRERGELEVAGVWRGRKLYRVSKEAIQVAAMAIRFALEVCDEERGRK